MKMSRLMIAGLMLAMACVSLGSEPPSANDVVKQAVSTARKGHKGVLVIFHASWCGWCKQLDKTFDVPEFKAILDKDYVVVHLTVLEDPAHKADVNPGGEDLLAKVGGKDSGIPYFYAVDATGKVVADSRVVEGSDQKVQNMGFPTEPVEIKHLLEMLKLANPALSDADSATLRSVLEARAAEIKAGHH